MEKFLKYYFIPIFFSIGYCAKAQYLCDNEYKVINKQKKTIQKKAKNITNVWILSNGDELNIPDNIKLTSLKYLTKEDENWEIIDSLLCVGKSKELIEKAKKRLQKQVYKVYDIRGYFNFPDSPNPQIRSILYFDFDINGDLIRVVIREKEFSPFSETYYH